MNESQNSLGKPQCLLYINKKFTQDTTLKDFSFFLSFFFGGGGEGLVLYRLVWWPTCLIWHFRAEENAKVKIKLLPPKQSEVRQKQHSADDNSYKEHLLKYTCIFLESYPETADVWGILYLLWPSEECWTQRALLPLMLHEEPVSKTVGNFLLKKNLKI